MYWKQRAPPKVKLKVKIIVNIKLKIKFTTEQAMKAQSWSRGIALLFP
jgi:hypothetical protein